MNGDERRPSEVLDEYWLTAVNRTKQRSPPSGRSGKWLLFIPENRIDEEWVKIKRGTESGVLGDASKVSTAKPNPMARDSSTKVICVYTRDHEDECDVMRVREKLRELGFESKIPYKTDEATLSGKYQVHGNKKISKYYC